MLALRCSPGVKVLVADVCGGGGRGGGGGVAGGGCGGGVGGSGTCCAITPADFSV